MPSHCVATAQQQSRQTGFTSKITKQFLAPNFPCCVVRQPCSESAVSLNKSDTTCKVIDNSGEAPHDPQAITNGISGHCLEYWDTREAGRSDFKIQILQ